MGTKHGFPGTVIYQNLWKEKHFIEECCSLPGESNFEDEVGSSTSSEEVFCNPWALKCHRDHLKKLGLLSPGSSTPTTSLVVEENHQKSPCKKPQNYLLLENLVSRYKYPCILDLKVGTRQYADDVSAAKKARKIAKTQSTTSATLGLRLTGMQVKIWSQWFFCIFVILLQEFNKNVEENT